ncbi:SLC13 family permease [Arthrobacter sp. CDRTa11]|uniref:SLC13 family permease n=1 Tax=Arthrobacter sp. CDRTa11 TaxID=2651199 RepID=UPI002265CE60|nr:SLC13 family permease [Arthrobacter sp. CDRTa11]
MIPTTLRRTETAAPTPRTKSSYLLNTLIGLALMAVISLLPAPAPLTPTGMAVVGVFVGTLYLWTTVDLVWPSVLGIALSAFFINSVMEPAALHGIWKSLQESVGNWVVAFVIGSLLLTYALNESGLTSRIADWFLSRRWARRSPWAFTYTLFACAFFLGMFLDLIPTLVFMIALLNAVFRKLGYTYGEKYPLVVIIGCTFLINIAFAITPISHPVTLIGLGVFTGASGGASIGFVEYMLVGIPVGVVAACLIILFLRYVVKPGMERFNDVDFAELATENATPLSRREVATAVIFSLVVITWILPGLVSLIDPQAGIVTFFDEITLIVPTLFGVILLMLLRIDGKPLLDHTSALRTVPWGVISLVACAMLFGTLLTEDAVGLNTFLVGALSPLFASGMSPLLVMLVMVLAIAFITNVANHVPVIIMFVAVCVPLAEVLGVDNRLVGTLVILAAQMGFALPSSLASVALIFGDPWVKPGAVVRYGVYATLVSALSIVVIGYPLATLVFAGG